MGEEDTTQLDILLALSPKQHEAVLQVEIYYGYWFAEATRDPIDLVALNTVTTNLHIAIDTFLMNAKQQAS